MSSIYDWSLVAANNGNSDSAINWSEGQAPSTVNGSARQQMAREREFVTDLGGSLAAGGTANGLTVTAASAFTAYANGQTISFRATASNTGAATLNVNGIGAKAIRKMDPTGDVALVANEIMNTGIYVAQYSASLNGAAGAWLLVNPTPGVASPLKADGRLTLTSAVPVTTANVSAAGTIYYTPYVGNVISLYSGTGWVNRTFAEISLALTATSGKPYDVFVYDNAGVATLETLVWTNDTTRATALVRQDGVLCKTSALTRRYVGTFYASGSNQTEDSKAKRFVWNLYNRVPRPMSVYEAAANWNYTITAIRQANGNAANQLDFVRGIDEDCVSATITASVSNASSALQKTLIGLDATNAKATDSTAGAVNTLPSGLMVMIATYSGLPGAGRHFLAWLESSTATGTSTWYGDAGIPSGVQNGIVGTVMA